MTTGPGDSDGGRGAAATPSDVPAARAPEETLPSETLPSQTLVSGTVGDRCVGCGAPLSSDQRYCVNCGERRGAPRFTLPTAVAEEPAAAPPRRREPRGPRVSSAATLVAGVGTLLLAMGVGVLIGHTTSNATRTAAAAPTQVIRVGGGSGASRSESASGSRSSSRRSSRRARRHRSVSNTRRTTTAPKVTQAAAKKESSAAAKVLGGSAKNVPPPTVTVGQKGSGAGFNKKTHKFDGSFFGQ